MAIFGLLLLVTCRPEARIDAGTSTRTDQPASSAPTSPEFRLVFSSGWGSGYILELDAKDEMWYFTDRKSNRRKSAKEKSAATVVACFTKALEEIPEPGGLDGMVDGATYCLTINHGEKQLVRSFGQPSQHFLQRVLELPPPVDLDKERQDIVAAKKKDGWAELKSHWSAFYLELEITQILHLHFPDSGFTVKPNSR